MTEQTGNIEVRLTHYALGQGSTGGYPHAKLLKPNMTIGPNTVAEVHLDMCSSAAMWSEEYCEYNLWAWLDLNSNKVLDANEPEGRMLVDVSCHDEGPKCHQLELDCTTGMSCASFTDPAFCTAPGPACK